jgi:uncharacterized membrane protein YdjX (TVP38/TMEM64 family)
MMKKIKMNKFNICTLIIFAGIAAFIFYGYKIGLFSSVDTFKSFVADFGVWAILIFILIQTISIIVPFLPTSIGCIAGIIIFGPWLGFLYNYIGICIGSIIAFILSKRYGIPLVQGILGKKSYDKYIGWTERGKKFDTIFAAAIFFPVAPDDFLCYIAGLTKMKLKKFVPIILLCKPFSLVVYSFGLTSILHFCNFIK